MIDPTFRRFASPVVAHRVLDGAFASVSIHAMSAHGKMRPTRARRRGQALLIAVLLMVFAAVLGATFVTVVALNLNQTARSGSVNTARIAAIAGSNYVNDQLTNSPLGENWRPQLDASQPSASGDTYYYTDFERAQGWDQPDATTEVVGGYPSPTPTKPQFVKFPDPRSTAITGNNTPTYLTKVEPVVAPLITDPDHERDGQLKVTVIGRSSDNDAAYSTLVFYKPTTQNGNMTSFARYDSNWNFGAGRMVQTRWSNVSTVNGDINDTVNPTVTVLTVSSTQGFAPGKTIVVGTTSPKLAIVRQVDPVAGTLTLNKTITPAANDTLIRTASPYMAGLPSLDALGQSDGSTAFTPQTTDAPIESGRGSVLIHNAMYLEGKVNFTLQTPNSLTPRTTNPDSLSVVGPVFKDPTASAVVTDGNATATDLTTIPNTSPLKPYVRFDEGNGFDPTSRTGSVHAVTPPRLDGVNSRWLQVTKLADTNNGSLFGYGPGVYINNSNDLETVGRRTDAPATAADNYRRLTIAETQRLWMRKSIPVATPSSPDTREYGNIAQGGAPSPLAGQAYVTNPALPADVLAVQNNAHRLSWPRPGQDSYTFPIPTPTPTPTAGPTPTPSPFANLKPSLEERGVRGWISPYEFLPRGTLIELQGDKIIITRDDLSDKSADQPDTNNTWRKPNGDYLTDDGTLNGATTTFPGARTYRMELQMANVGLTNEGMTRSFGAPGATTGTVSDTRPFNGVIYAEGNVRVRGFLGDKDITIVSMGNIYVEGSLNRPKNALNQVVKGHVALLAKRNVVLNPTQFAAHVAGSQDFHVGGVITTADVNDTNTQIKVAENTAGRGGISNLRIGDVIRVDGDPSWHTITASQVTPAPAGTTYTDTGTITVTPAFSLASPILASTNYPTVPAPAVHLLSDPAAAGNRVNRLSRLDDGGRSVFTRNLPLNGVAAVGNYRLAVAHAGQRIPVFTLLRLLAAGPGGVTSKQDTDSSRTVTGGAGTTPNEKILATSDSASSIDLRPSTLRSLLPQINTQFGPNWNATPTARYDPNILSWRLAGANDTGVGDPLTPSHDFLVATAAGIYWRQNLDTLKDTTTPVLLPTNVDTNANFFIGSGFLPNGSTINDASIQEDPDTVSENFYPTTPVGVTVPTEQQLQWTNNYPLYSTPTYGSIDVPDKFLNNQVTMRLKQNDTGPFTPDYYIGAVKYDRDTFADIVNPSTGPGPGPIPININATIYAQDGSWFVIPMPSMTSNRVTPNAAAVAAANRYRRLNYQIQVAASIGENFAPTSLADYDLEQTPDQTQPALGGTLVSLGAQAQWLDAAAYPTNGLETATDTRWQTINYLAPDILPSTNTLYLPITPDITNQR